MTMATSVSQFKFTITDRAVRRNLSQRLGRFLWLPMLAMGLIAFPVGLILAIGRSATIADGGSATTVAALGHFVPAANFLGFASVFAAISFAIARILGEFREGGGRLQEATGRRVATLEAPLTAKLFIVAMATAMMVLLGAVVLHVVAGAAIARGSAFALARTEQWSIWLEGVRRFGVALYLLSIAFGLATVITVVRFQADRLRQLPEELAITG
jgi:hypothetical protein